jgi:hypothetical protein
MYKLNLGMMSSKEIVYRKTWRVILVISILICLFIIDAKADESQKIGTTRPDPEGTPTEVKVSFYVINIESIDNVGQHYTVDFVLTLSWQDDRLADSPGMMELNEVWNPIAYIFNSREIKKLMPEIVYISDKGNVFYVQRFYGKLTSPFDLKSFPFDEQTLPITFVSMGYGPEEVRFIFDAEHSGRDEKFSISDWDISSGVGKVGVYKGPSPRRKNNMYLFSRVDYEMKAQRFSFFYLWKVVVPIMIIVFMSWAVFWIDPSHFAPQIGLATTSILTNVAFILSLGYVLPPVSYLTKMDYLVYSSLSLVFLAFLEAIITSKLAASGKKKLALRFDRLSRWVFPVLFIIVLYLFLN